MSDDEVWIKKYNILKRKCDGLEQENESLYWKLKRVKKMVSESENETKLLKNRLLQYNRTTPTPKKSKSTKSVPNQTSVTSVEAPPSNT